MEQRKNDEEKNKNDDKLKDQEEYYDKHAQKVVGTKIGNTIKDNVINPSMEDVIDDDDNNQNMENDDNNQKIEDALEDKYNKYEVSKITLHIDDQICETRINNMRFGVFREIKT